MGNIISIKSTGKKERMYDMEVEDAHSYLANGIVCHNSNLIFTGKESQEDIDEFIDNVKILVENRAEIGAVLPNLKNILSKKWLDELERRGEIEEL